MATRGGFAAAVMEGLDVDRTLHNRRAFMAWFQAEGGNAKFNPANTTKTMPGATNYNWIGVKNYVSFSDGVKATVATFHEKNVGYEAILHSLRSNASAAKTLKAIGASQWGTGGTLAMVIRSELARIPGYLATLEAKPIAS